MSKNEKSTKDMTLPSKSSFGDWFNSIIELGEIMDVRYPVKGLYVWYPFGFAIRKRVYNVLRDMLDETGHQETQFPLLIPETEFMKEAEHIKGFEDEVYWVTQGGLTPLDVNLALRPTSETAIYPMYKLWVRSHSDMPILLYQIVNTFRYETKATRPLIRLREITSFKEAHTVHATWEEAADQVDRAVEIYVEFFKRLAVPVLVSKRPDWDKFPGGDYTIALDVIMPDGRTLQVGTCHHLGTNFAKTYDIKYEDLDGNRQYANQTCYGISERCIASLISVHGDDNGLVLPPEFAPVQVVVIPILFKKDSEEIMNACNKIVDDLRSSGFRVELDASDLRPGAKYYKWEMKGVCARIEVGPRDLENGSAVVVFRNKGEKTFVPFDELNQYISDNLENMCNELYKRAENKMKEKIFHCDDLEQVKESIGKGVTTVHWCGSEDCGLMIEEIVEAGILGIPENKEIPEGRCPVCGKSTDKTVYIAKTY